jgi:hypothetical protein
VSQAGGADPPGSGTQVLVAALLGIFGVVIGIAAIAGSGGSPAGIAAGVAGFVVFGGLAYWLFRRAVPPDATHLRVTVATREVRRGETVHAQLQVVGAEPGDEGIEFGLVCTEYYEVKQIGADTADPYVFRNDVAYEEWRPASPGPGPQVQRFDVPADAPFTYRGKCLAFEWDVRARHNRRIGFAMVADAPVRVLP